MAKIMMIVFVLAGAWCFPSVAVQVPCANMLTESGAVGDQLQAGIKLCEASDASVPSPGTQNVKLQVFWYHPETGNGPVTAKTLDMGKYVAGMTWSDLAAVCRQDNRCNSFIADHVQEDPGQICVQLVVGANTSASHRSPAQPGCVVVGNECSWETSNYLVDFGTVKAPDVNGLTKDISVNIQCGFITGVSFSLESDELALVGSDASDIRASFALDGAPLSTTPLTLTERQGNNLHTLKTTLKSSGKLSGGVFSSSLVIIAGYD